MLQKPPDIEAVVSFIPTAEGGKSNAVKSGYRPNHLVKEGYLTSGHHEYLDKELVSPGESATAHIWFISPEQYPHTMQVGSVIRVQEGSRLVGHAKVTKVFNEILAKQG
jgi:translation elongation factor EF-Tu-like GTPase